MEETLNEQKWYGIYLRVSTSEQAQQREGSITSQLQRIQEHLKYRFGEVPQIVYKDEGLSGKDTNRPEFQKLVSNIEAGFIHAVICTELSRVSRSVIDFHKFIDLCNKYKVGFISLREQFDTLTSQGKLMLSIFASFAQFEREQISERTSANLLARARRGLWNGGYLFGYRPRLQQRGYLDIDEKEATIINAIFEKYLETGSYCKVVEYINEQGYRTREYITRKGKIHPSQKWSKSSVLQILRNPAYIGQRRVEKDIVKAVWSPIVDHELWQKVQDLLDENYKIRGNKIAAKGHTYLFSGMIQCMHCNAILENGSGTGRSGNIHYYYRHPSKAKKEDCIHPTNLPAEQLEKFIYGKLSELIDDEELANMVCADVQERMGKDIDNIQKQSRFVEQELIQIEAQLKGYAQKILLLEDQDIQTLITPMIKELREKQRTLMLKKNELAIRLTMLKEEIITKEDIQGEIKLLVENFETLDSRQKQRILRLFVEKVEMYKDRFKIFIYVYKEKNHSNILNLVRTITNWLPRLGTFRTITTFSTSIFFRIQIAQHAEIFICDGYKKGVLNMKLYKLVDKENKEDKDKVVANACDFGEYVAVCWKTNVPSMQIYRSMEEWKYVACTIGKRVIQEVGEVN